MASNRLTPDAFASLYQQHHRALWCIAAAIVSDRTAAYDIVQEAAMTALAKLDEFDAEGVGDHTGSAAGFVAWVGQIVRFLALNHRRGAMRSRFVPSDPSVLAAVAPAAAQHTPGETAFSAQLTGALGDLDDTARACLLMRTVMDMTYRQIAEALNIPEGTAMSHVHRSRQVLRRKLEAADDGAAEGRDA